MSDVCHLVSTVRHTPESAVKEANYWEVVSCRKMQIPLVGLERPVTFGTAVDRFHILFH